MVALIATMTFTLYSCGSDEPDGGDKSGKVINYSFKFNDTPFYYGVSYPALGWDETIYLAWASKMTDGYYYLQSFPINVPLEYFDYDKDEWIGEKETLSLHCQFNVKAFDPSKAKKGDVLKYDQLVRDGWDDFNIIEVYAEPDHNAGNAKYQWKATPVGAIKFVSYEKKYNDFDDLLILEFDNITMQLRGGKGLDAPKTAVLNGQIRCIMN